MELQFCLLAGEIPSLSEWLEIQENPLSWRADNWKLCHVFAEKLQWFLEIIEHFSWEIGSNYNVLHVHVLSIELNNLWDVNV